VEIQPIQLPIAPIQSAFSPMAPVFQNQAQEAVAVSFKDLLTRGGGRAERLPVEGRTGRAGPGDRTCRQSARCDVDHGTVWAGAPIRDRSAQQDFGGLPVGFADAGLRRVEFGVFQTTARMTSP
jgi:hypothetical protein